MSYSDYVIADAPFGYWRLNETGQAGVALDSSGNHRDGTLPGGVVFLEPGLVFGTDTAAHFDGSDISRIDNNASLSGITGGFAIDAWVKTDTLTTDSPAEPIMRVIWASRNDTYLAMRQLDAARFVFSVRIGDVQQTIASVTALVVGQVYYVVGTWDGVKLRLFVNGLLDAESAQFTGATSLSSALPWYIGSYLGDGDRNWLGTIDDLALYAHALSATRIADRYTVGTIGANSPVEYRILLSLQTALQQIAVAGGYHYDVAAIAVKLDPNVSVEQLIGDSALRPFVILEMLPDAYDYSGVKGGPIGRGRVIVKAPFIVHAVNDSDVVVDESWIWTYYRLVADVEQALAVDIQRGGLAYETRVLTRKFQTFNGEQVWASVQGEVRLTRNYGDPNGS